MLPVLYAYLQVNDPSLTSELTASIKPTLNYLMTLKFPSGNYPSSVGSGSGDLLVHWCHGAPGWVHLFALAYKVCILREYSKLVLLIIYAVSVDLHKIASR